MLLNLLLFAILLYIFNLLSSDKMSDVIDIGDDIHLRVVKWGNIKTHTEIPIVLVHGLASNALLWEGSAIELTTLGHPVVAVDLRGHGPVSTKTTNGYDMLTVTDDIARLLTILSLKEFGGRKPIVAGQSWGGNLVLELSHKYPDIIKGVVLVDGGFYELSNRFSTWEECENKLKPPNLIGKPVDDMRAYLIQAHPTWPETGINGMMANFEVTINNTIRPWLTYERHIKILYGLWLHKPSAIYHEIKTPVFFIPAEGSHDYESKKRMIDKALESLSDGKVTWIKADHDLHAQYPQRFAQMVHEWSKTK